MWGWADAKMSRCEDEKMWRWEDVKMRRCEDQKMWRCEDEKMWGWEDVKMRRCEDEKMWRWREMWRWEDVKIRMRCEDVEDEKMWRWEDVKMRRCEDEKTWRWEDVKMRRCEDQKVWRWEDVKMRRWEQTPTIGRTLRSDALREQNLTIPLQLELKQDLLFQSLSRHQNEVVMTPSKHANAHSSTTGTLEQPKCLPLRWSLQFLYYFDSV